jgi:predicted transcriptional regulator
LFVNAYARLTNRSGKGAEKLLGELELAVMDVIWERGIITVREVLEALMETRPLAYTTVMTVMSRLADKGLLVADKQGKTYHYRPAQSRAEFEAQTVGQVVQSLIRDFGGEIAISQFVEQLSAADPEQLARLAALAQLTQEEQAYTERNESDEP